CRQQFGVRSQLLHTFTSSPNRHHLSQELWNFGELSNRTFPNLRTLELWNFKMSDRLFTPRFFIMCGFTFTVFLSVFQLLPTAPFHILDLGGSTFASGLFLGFLTYASALSAPATGALADRLGTRRILLTSSLAIAGFSIAYAL